MSFYLRQFAVQRQEEEVKKVEINVKEQCKLRFLEIDSWFVKKEKVIGKRKYKVMSYNCKEMCCIGREREERKQKLIMQRNSVNIGV